MKNPNSRLNKSLSGEAQACRAAGDKIRVLVVDGHPVVRHELVQLISCESDFGVCVEAESAAQTLEAIEKQQVDVAVIDISLEGATGMQLAERIKLESPTLPVLILSMQDESSRVERASMTGSQRHVLNRQAGEQIIGAVNYIRSLLRSRIFGFTVFVNVERSATDG